MAPKKLLLRTNYERSHGKTARFGNPFICKVQILSFVLFPVFRIQLGELFVVKRILFEI